MSKRHLYILCLTLTILGGGVFLYKWLLLDFPIVPAERTETWGVEARMRFQATGRPVKLSLHIPRNSGRFTLVDQNFISPGYALTTSQEGANRLATFSIARARGQQVIYYRATVHARDVDPESVIAPPPRLEQPSLDEPSRAAAQAIVDTARRQAADTETLVALLLKRLQEAGAGDEARLLLGRAPGQLKTAQVMVDLLAVARVPARIVHGLPLGKDRRAASFSQWIEVYEKDRWRPYNLDDGGRGRPAMHVPWWRGPDPFAALTGANRLTTEIAVSQSFEFALRAALVREQDAKSWLIKMSTLGLPLQTQTVYRILLTLPIGIFLLVVLRNIIGIKTFGTFMPILMALAFRETQLVWGLALFSIVLSIGLSVRFYLEHLKLLLVPRLGAVVIVVILIMAVLSLFSHQLGFERGLSVALFPVVILTMTIERMSIVWDERGPSEAFQQVAGSLAVAAVAYTLMQIEQLEHLTFVFPELLLIVLALTLLVGRYGGYRLVELTRFKVLAGR